MENMSVSTSPYHETMNKNLPVLALLCDADSACKGFSSKGLLYDSVDTPVPMEGVDFYMKN